MRVAWGIFASLMAWASSPRSGPNHQPFVTEKKIAKQFLSHRRHQLIIPRKSVGWWVSNVDDLKAWSWKQIISQRGPVGTSQKSSDDEFSEFVIPSNERMIFGNKSVWMPYLSVRECLYSMWGMVTCLVTVPISEVTSITAMEVTLFGIYIPQWFVGLDFWWFDSSHPWWNFEPSKVQHVQSNNLVRPSWTNEWGCSRRA